MELFTTIETADAILADWKVAARKAPAGALQASLRRQVRDLELWLSLARKRFHDASRACSDLRDYLAAQGVGATVEIEEAANHAE